MSKNKGKFPKSNASVAPQAPTPPPVAAPAPTPAPVARPLNLKGQIARIDVDKTGKADRFIMVIADGHQLEYFSTPLSSVDSVRITTQQLKSAFPELMNVKNVFVHLLMERNKYIGRDVEYSVSIQIDRETKKPKINPRTNLPYTNVRIEPSSAGMSEADALQLLGGASIGGGLDIDDLPAE